ncbi:MAG: ABC transporter permease [Planctomycetaceae bacterium]|nr:ABC transporter permease [Planctomycetaceae bacterium]
MKKNLGILGILLVVFMTTALGSERFFTAYNMFNLIERTSLYGIIGIGVAFVIITGGIDLSIGSAIGLVAVALPWIVIDHGLPLPVGLLAVLSLVVFIGVSHGLLITKLRMQPFVVTLCGLMIYRGVSRWLVADRTMGYGDERFAGMKVLVGKMSELPGLQNAEWAKHVPVALLILIVLGGTAAVFLNQTIYGRYLLALGRNEQAARFSGINTTAMIVLAYVICSLITGLGGILFALDYSSIQPDSFGNFYELHAIAAAVLGGCSLRGGEGSVFGIILGAALMRLLMNSISMLGIEDQLEQTVIGVVILTGVTVDEIVKRLAAKRRATLQAREATGN